MSDGQPDPGRPAATVLTRVPLFDGTLPALRAEQPSRPGRVVALRTNPPTSLHVRDTPGPDRAGDLAVYVHGLGGTANNFADLAELLAIRMPGVAVDLPGFGCSEPPSGFDFALDSQAEVLTQLVATSAADRRVHLVGNSMGGLLAVMVAATHPELVTSLTLISPAVPDLRPDPRRMSEPRQALTFLPWVGPWVRRNLVEMSAPVRSEQLLRQCFADPSLLGLPRRTAFEADHAAWRDAEWAPAAFHGTVSALARAWFAAPSRSIWTLLGRVVAPTLVIWGRHDKIIGVRKAQRTARCLPRGRLFVVPRAGHLAQLERPVSVARAMLGMCHAVQRGEW